MISFIDIGLFRLSGSPYVSLGRLCLWRNWSILSKLFISFLYCPFNVRVISSDGPSLVLMLIIWAIPLLFLISLARSLSLQRTSLWFHWFSLLISCFQPFYLINAPWTVANFWLISRVLNFGFWQFLRFLGTFMEKRIIRVSNSTILLCYQNVFTYSVILIVVVNSVRKKYYWQE